MSATIRALISIYAELESREKIDDMLLAKIDLDRAFKYLSETRALTDLERHVLSIASRGISRTQAAKELGINRLKYIKLLSSAARKIADYLGSEYSDEVILRKVQKQVGRKLSKQEVKNCLFRLSTYSGEVQKQSIFEE